MKSHIVSDEARMGNLATLQRAFASANMPSQEQLAHRLRINAGYSHVECVRYLLEKRADPSLSCCSLTNRGVPGLPQSTRRNSVPEACVWGASAEVVSLLLEHHADVNLQAKYKGKSLSAKAIAISKGNLTLAQLKEDFTAQRHSALRRQ